VSTGKRFAFRHAPALNLRLSTIGFLGSLFVARLFVNVTEAVELGFVVRAADEL
jgi:hypothetical protein